MRIKKHYPVNWVDGMKINKSHFLAQEDNLRDQLELHAALYLNEYNYGIIEGEGSEGSVSLNVNSESIQIFSCQAITRGGHYIEVSDVNNSDLHRPLSDLLISREYRESDVWTVILRITADEKDLIGEPDANETPLRHPHATPRITIEALPAEDLVTINAYRDAVPVAQVTREYNGMTQIKTYLPPLTTLRADKTLMTGWQHNQQLIVETETFLYEIIRKINDKHIHGKHNALSQDLMNLTSAVTRYINDHFDRYLIKVPTQPPLEYILWFKGLARVIVSEMRLAANSDNLEKYIAFFINNSDRYQLLQISSVLKDLRYDHGDIRAAVDNVDQFIQSVNSLFKQLRTLQYAEIADPTIINSMRTGNMGLGEPTARRAQTNSRPSSPPPSPATTTTGGNRKINIRRSNRTLNEPPANEGGEGGNFWNLED